MIKYGERIAQLRENSALTQEELAGKLGISRAALSHYETSRREPDYDTINKIAAFFNVSIDYLLSSTGSEPAPVNQPARHVAELLELTDEQAIGKCAFAIDGRRLTADEVRRFIAFVRDERALKS
ncbi:helix-turn-helix transcriptional regulator [Paenibacillus athensensis]|uniref:Transcriptional regulator n=1 Tax=Paenibacillus athensensis TaxID=1967502 RepID=A0A4Y8Q6R4_9BACL|nr:helix-turn-helix transcriptional regulator [Paenibacillus athensensis]MCD1259472.1 helix-turn-helix transcriptional regulator [Paenibacillus athensensis]